MHQNLLNHCDSLNCRFRLGVKAGAPTFPAALVVPAFSVWELGSRGLIYMGSTKTRSSVKWFINDSCCVTSSNPQHGEIGSRPFIQWNCISRHSWLVASPLLSKRQVSRIPGRIHEVTRETVAWKTKLDIFYLQGKPRRTSADCDIKSELSLPE